MPKLLGEFLQEQQEPFVLDVYLLERGCYTHITQDSTRFFNRSASRPQRKRRLPIPNCSEIVRAVFSRLVLHKRRTIKNTGINGCGEEGIEANDRKRRGEDHADEDKFSSASATTLYNSCSESDVEDAECITKQSSLSHELSPISVLEETECQGPPLHKKQYNFKKMQGESSKSISKCKSKQPTHKFEESTQNQYSINKRALQQTKQLLVDCVREVIENQRKQDNETGQQLKKILGAEELWKLVCENVWLWSRDSIDETNIAHMLNSDFMASLEEWSSASDQHKNDVAMEIGDAILEDIVNEIVTCMLVKNCLVTTCRVSTQTAFLPI